MVNILLEWRSQLVGHDITPLMYQSLNILSISDVMNQSSVIMVDLRKLVSLRLHITNLQLIGNLN